MKRKKEKEIRRKLKKKPDGQTNRKKEKKVRMS